MTHAIELIDVRGGYGRIEVLHGVDLAIPAGTVYALLGPNGGGKSTTLKVISGELTPKSGCVHISGTHVNGARPDGLARAGVSRIPEGRGVFPNLTVDENLRMWTYAAGLSHGDVRDKAFTRLVDLNPLPETMIILAQVKTDRGAYAEAVPLFDKAIGAKKASGQPVPEVWVKVADQVRTKVACR